MKVIIRKLGVVNKTAILGMILLLSGCLNLGAAYPTGTGHIKKKPNDYSIGVGNHTGGDIYIESLHIDSRLIDRTPAYINCSNRLDVNGISEVYTLEHGTSLPRKNIEIVWDPLKSETYMKAVINMPQTDFIRKYVKENKGSSYLYVDIRENNHVWLRLTNLRGKIESKSDVFVIAKAKAEPVSKIYGVSADEELAKKDSIERWRNIRLSFEKWKSEYISKIEKLSREIAANNQDVEIAIRHDSRVTELERKKIDLEYSKTQLERLENKKCWSEEEKINYISEYTHATKEKIIFDNWYPNKK